MSTKTPTTVTRITREEADAIIAARTALWNLKQRAYFAQDDQVGGMLYGTADGAMDALFHVLNLASSYGNCPEAVAAIERDKAEYSTNGGPRK